MNKIFWQLGITVLLILYAANWSTISPVGGDEKIYIIASSWLDNGFIVNGEHPPLVKIWYNLLLPKEYKAEVMGYADLISRDLWIPNYYRYPREQQLIQSGGVYLRLIDGLLFTAFLLYIWYHSKDFGLFLSLYALFFAGDMIFTALLDNWLILSTVLGYYLVINNNKIGWVLTCLVAPLTKFYGFLVTPFAILKAPNRKIFMLSILAVIITIVGLWGINSVFDGIYHYSKQLGYIYDPEKGAKGWIFYGYPIRYAIPFIGIAIIKYYKKGV